MDWSSIWNRAPRRRRRAAPAAEPLEGRALLSSFGFARERPEMRLMAERAALHRVGRHPTVSPTTTASGTSSAPATTGDPSGGTAPATPSTSTSTATTTGAPSAPTTSGGFGMGHGSGMARGFGRRGGFGMGGFGGGMMAPMQGAGMSGSGSGTSSGTATPDARFTALQQYQTDVKTIYDKSQVTPALQAALTNDLQAIRSAATTAPDQTKVLALQSDLSSLGGTLPTSAQLATLQTDFAAVATSEGVTDASKVTQTFTDLNALIAATNVTATDVTTLTNDLKAAGLSTTAPLVAPLGVNLEILNLAVNYQPALPISPPATTTSTTSTTTSTS
jgi:hypothetical protein